jgi:hypothetical protein
MDMGGLLVELDTHEDCVRLSDDLVNTFSPPKISAASTMLRASRLPKLRLNDIVFRKKSEESGKLDPIWVIWPCSDS